MWGFEPPLTLVIHLFPISALVSDESYVRALSSSGPLLYSCSFLPRGLAFKLRLCFQIYGDLNFTFVVITSIVKLVPSDIKLSGGRAVFRNQASDFNFPSQATLGGVSASIHLKSLERPMSGSLYLCSGKLFMTTMRLFLIVIAALSYSCWLQQLKVMIAGRLHWFCVYSFPGSC